MVIDNIEDEIEETNGGKEQKKTFEDELALLTTRIREELGTPPPLSIELRDTVNVRMNEYAVLNDRLKSIKRAIEEKELKEKEKKRLDELDLSQRNPEVALLALHKTVRIPEIVRYLNDIGDIIVYELDRGIGKNVILFSKIDASHYYEKIAEFESQKPYIEKSRRTEADKQKSLKEIEDRIKNVRDELEYLKNTGGNILLYIERDDRYYKLDLFSKSDNKNQESLSVLQVYFGKNNNFEDSFHEFNTVQKIMEYIRGNLEKYGGKDFIRLNNDIDEMQKKVESEVN